MMRKLRRQFSWPAVDGNGVNGSRFDGETRLGAMRAMRAMQSGAVMQYSKYGTAQHQSVVCVRVRMHTDSVS